MLHWLRNRKGRNLQQFWIKLLSVSLVAHGLLLIAIFFLYKDDSCQYNMTVNSKNLRRGAPIIFMPFHKVVNAHRIHGQLSTSIGAVKATTVTLAPSVHKKKASTALVAAEKEKKAAKKVKEQKRKERKLKEQQLKEKKAKEHEKLKRAEKKKRQEERKKEKEKEEIKKQEEPKKEEIIKPEPELPQPVPQPQLEQQVGTAGAVGDQPVGPIDPVYMGQVEMEEMNRQEELQQVITQYWRPPVGLQEGLECTLTFVVDADGNAAQVEIQKTSGVLVYDMAARMAVAQMQMPQWARGKELSITFI